jgi:hypothetical protein
MKKIAFVIVWCGAFPAYFPLWLKSCENNPTIDFLLFTDQKQELALPSNVKRQEYSFEMLQKKFAENFDFPIRLAVPYKFCDYKPSYGEVFAEYLSGYDFWGYCDADLIWGDIRHYLTDEILEANERIFTRGHCSLFRNNKQVNAYYRTLPGNGHLNCREVYQSDANWCFDEWAGHCGGGISVIFKENGIPTYDEPVMADILVGRGRFTVNRRPDLKEVDWFEYEDGKLYAATGGGTHREELMYCHFQKRPVSLQNHGQWRHLKLVPVGTVLEWEDREKKGRIRMDVAKYDCKIFLKKIWSRMLTISSGIRRRCSPPVSGKPY